MSTHNSAAAHSHGHGEKAHGTVTLYMIFAVILCVITYFEWWIFEHRESIGISQRLMIVSLLALSAVKFVMVCGWYMHLRYDHKSLTKLFIGGMFLATATYLALGVIVHPKECDALKGECFKIQEPAPAPDTSTPADAKPAEAAPTAP